MYSVDISAIIIDDDDEAINLLEMFLRNFPSIKVVAKSSNPVIGLELIKKTIPDLVFLDIDMPDMTGLQVAQSIKNENIKAEIVFTTAFQDYAYKALKIEPLDFLTKPFSSADLEIVVKKYISRAEKKLHEQKLDVFFHTQLNQSKISLPTSSGILVVDIKDIVYVRADSFRTILYLQDRSVETVNKSLSKLIQLLNSSVFFQINRSVYLNLNYLQRIDKKKKMCYIAYNQTVLEEPIARNYIVSFEKLNIYPAI
ncbi:MAG: hypothetical protein A2066_04410 [Bacteroidetes bacterium GWB2_41_8]|nr:MAG: hypothetical protein A2066_04410 [Bacteroidetes bacterium GWB2_41_8]